MKYYGMDIHKRYSVYTVVDEDGKVLDQGRIANQPEALSQVVDRDGSAKVVMEATCNWYYLYDLLEGMVDEVCLAHPLRTKAIASARVKTDKVDATTLAHLLRADLIPRAYIPPREVRELRELLRQRASLVRLATQVKNKVHALLTKNGILLRLAESPDSVGTPMRRCAERTALQRPLRSLWQAMAFSSGAASHLSPGVGRQPAGARLVIGRDR